jgi:hypothetical protein
VLRSALGVAAAGRAGKDADTNLQLAVLKVAGKKGRARAAVLMDAAGEGGGEAEEGGGGGGGAKTMGNVNVGAARAFLDKVLGGDARFTPLVEPLPELQDDGAAARAAAEARAARGRERASKEKGGVHFSGRGGKAEGKAGKKEASEAKEEEADENEADEL